MTLEAQFMSSIFSGGKELYDKIYHALDGDGGTIDFNEFVTVDSVAEVAEPFIEAYITRIKFHPRRNSIVLYMMLNNTGGRDAEVTAFDVEYLDIYDAAGRLLWSGNVTFNDVRNCYVQAGGYISEIPFTIDDAQVPAYRGDTTTDWNYRVYWSEC